MERRDTLLWQEAERLVADYLERVGFQIVATNLRVGRLEIDIVARRRELIVVVEVRTRGETAWTRALASIDWKKRERVRRAGQRLWGRRYRMDPSAERLRFDVASVTFGVAGAQIEYVPAAF
ncbi:MAG: YraN family protein [Polyangiaceae bacterium]|nr:YraN family protein [Myxococcales bacterium]MCB9583949.1 YraN family protein [Polyangiaceae bacterium]MCB9607795.1 YraN family protein [Polyangiaceae bacterium]